jgi:DNA-binding transcriptional LysR family regulator
VTFPTDTYAGRLIDSVLEDHGVKPRIVLISNVAPTLCEFVAAGLGVSLLHPLTLSGLEDRLTVRRFEPEILYDFKLCRRADSKNGQFVEAFAQELRTTAGQISRSMLGKSKGRRPRAGARP